MKNDSNINNNGPARTGAFLRGCLTALGIILLAACGACAWAPNNHAETVYFGQGKPYYSETVSGPIPPLKYWLPWNWFKTPPQ